MSKTIGIIPARGGSKGIPRKNIKLLADKPLIAWTIEAALDSHGLDRVIVSTDDEQIAKISREWGAQVPFLRPARLAEDNSPAIAVVLHALDQMDLKESFCPDYVLLLQPTSPLRTSQDIDNARQMASRHNADAVVSICVANPHPYLTKRLSEDGTIADFVPLDKVYTRRQDFPPAYALNGAIYLNRRSSLLREKTFHPVGTYGYVMPEENSIDIDNPWDFHLADLILRDRLARS
jgi:CMP-N,N'-diacetyllegionaminic acid synthase